MRRVSWEQHRDMILTQLQETGRIRIAFISLFDLYSACEALGINPRDVRFEDGYAIVDGVDKPAANGYT